MSRWRRWLGAVLLTAALSDAHAHLVVSQHGTLNIVGSGAYMVLSVPVSALSGVDDDHDSLLSVNELRAHGDSIAAQIRRGVSLDNGHGRTALEGLMLNTAPPDSNPGAPSTHLVVLGRFAIGAQPKELMLALHLFGSAAEERSTTITVTRGEQAQLVTLTPARARATVLPSAWVAFAEQAHEGVLHVLTGADHLLFLLVVLTATWRLRQVIEALSCFTAGHAITLVACAGYGWSVPASLVEPAIAATIVGMAVLERWSARRNLHGRPALRLAAVFSCALVHGLGLADGLRHLGIDGVGRAVSLAGFNLGIELGQIAVALSAAVLLWGVWRLARPGGVHTTSRVGADLAMLVGAFWFFQRVLA